MFIQHLKEALREPLRIAVLVGPTGSGKSELAGALRMADPTLQWLISTTTRPPRENETSGQCEYEFISHDAFLALSNQQTFAWETSPQRSGHLYGTRHAYIQRALAASHISLALLRPQEAKLLKSQYPDKVATFYLYVPEGTRKERILKQRGDDPAYLEQGLQDSRDWDQEALAMQSFKLLDRFVHNDGHPLLAFEEIYGAIRIRSGKIFGV